MPIDRKTPPPTAMFGAPAWSFGRPSNGSKGPHRPESLSVRHPAARASVLGTGVGLFELSGENQWQRGYDGRIRR